MNWVLNNLDVILARTLDHLVISLPAIVLSFVIALPIGWLAHRVRLVRGPLLAVTGLLYAIPSLPLFIMLPIIFGFSIRSPLNIIVALVIYGVALMVRSVADGFDSVEPPVVQSAIAVGYASGRRFWTVQLPLAGPVLLAGLRVVAVSTISLVTIASVIGVQSLGSLFTDGFQRSIMGEVVAGIVMTVLLAVAIDLLLVLLGRILMPWSIAPRRARRGAEAD